MKPAASTICYESIILWSNNKTSEWLSSLDQESKNEILDQARQKAPDIKKAFLDRKTQIKKMKLQKLKEKDREMKIDLVNEIGKYGGLWQSSERVGAEVEELISNE